MINHDEMINHEQMINHDEIINHDQMINHDKMINHNQMINHVQMINTYIWQLLSYSNRQVVQMVILYVINSADAAPNDIQSRQAIQEVLLLPNNS